MLTAESGAHQHMAGGKSTVDSSAAIVMHGRRRTLWNHSWKQVQQKNKAGAEQRCRVL